MITRSRDRIKETGEVFTPLELVDEILDRLAEDEEVFSDCKKTFLDPACGDGNFLTRVFSYKINAQRENTTTSVSSDIIKQALRTIYGVDLMPDNVVHCKERLLQLADDYDTEIHGMKATKKKYGKIVDHNIICADSLNDWDYENWKRIVPPKTPKDVLIERFEF